MRTARRFDAWWDRFLFEPQPTTPLALVRIGYGSVLALWALSVLPDVGALYGDRRMALGLGEEVWRWRVLPEAASTEVALVVTLAVLLTGVLTAIGLLTRVASIASFVLYVGLLRHNPLVINSGDTLLGVVGLVVALGPSGSALSLDRWRRHAESFWIAPNRPPWALRLLQLHVSVGYFVSVLTKLEGATWRDGTAIGLALQVEDLGHLGVGDLLLDHPLAVNLVTWGVVAIELAIAVGVWFRASRYWVLALGLLLHLGIDLTLDIGFFSLVVAVTYLSFFPPVRDVRTVLTSDRWRRIGGLGRPRAGTSAESAPAPAGDT